ncbi:adenylyltransferase/cytidyltransferase family protein [Candidatus Latescibacterota bacterium]
MKRVAVSGAFDDLRSRQIRLLEEASRLGELHVLLWSDRSVAALTGRDPEFPQQERLYLLEAIRYVDRVTIEEPEDADTLPLPDQAVPDVWVTDEADHSVARQSYCDARGLECQALTRADLEGFPPLQSGDEDPSRKKVIVTGCFDWFHSGHVRFFEEVSELGSLYVAVGNDENVRHLKGGEHPMYPQDERRYVVQSVRHVSRAMITSGTGWMDAEPEIERYRPDIYAVNEDGDKPEKRAFCERHGLEYVVLERTPREGLQRRTSTDLRGF